jgi:CopG family nickel-responsive transcriptional regulator
MTDETLGASLSRLSMSLPTNLYHELDTMVQERGLPSRSQLIAELIRNALADHGEEAHPQALLAGTITLVYRGNMGRVREQLVQTQQAYLKEIISAQHVFLEDDQSLEVLLVQGPALRLRALCDDLRKTRGVQQLKLFTTTALLPPLHEQVSFKSARARRSA